MVQVVAMVMLLPLQRKVSVGRFSPLQLPGTLAVKWQVGNNPVPEAQGQGQRLLSGFLTGFISHHSRQECELLLFFFF